MKNSEINYFIDLNTMLSYMKETSKYLYKLNERGNNITDSNDIYFINMFIEGLQRTIDNGYKLTKDEE